MPNKKQTRGWSSSLFLLHQTESSRHKNLLLANGSALAVCSLSRENACSWLPEVCSLVSILGLAFVWIALSKQYPRKRIQVSYTTPNWEAVTNHCIFQDNGQSSFHRGSPKTTLTVVNPALRRLLLLTQRQPPSSMPRTNSLRACTRID